MSHRPNYRDSSVFMQPLKKRRKSMVKPGVPIAPVSFRRSTSMNNVVSIRHNDAEHAETSIRPGVSRQSQHAAPLPRHDSVVAREEASSEQTAESLSQEMSSQLTLTGEHERHPEQCTPAPAAMAVPISTSNEHPVQDFTSTGELQPPVPAPALARVRADTLFVREDTVESTATQLSQWEAQKYQAIVDRIDNKRDQDDPTFTLRDEPVYDDEPVDENLNPDPTSAHFTPETQPGTIDEQEDTSVDPFTRSPGAGADEIPIDNTDISPADAPPTTPGPSIANNISPARTKRRSPELPSTSFGKRSKKQDPRPRTWGKRFDDLLGESRRKRDDILTAIETMWLRRCQDVIPKQLWLRGEKEGLPLAPRDWPTNLLEEVKKLAQHTSGRQSRAVAALRTALSRQAIAHGGPKWLWSVNDVSLAIQLVISDDEQDTQSETDESLPESADQRTLSEELQRLRSAFEMEQRPSHNALVSRSDHSDETIENMDVDQKCQVLPDTPMEASTYFPPMHDHQPSPTPEVPIKQESPTAPRPPAPTGPALLAKTTPRDISSLTEDEIYTLKLLFDDEVDRRKMGGKPVIGNLSSWSLVELTAQDLSRLGASDFHRLWKMVEADWERWETVGSSFDNALVVD